VVGELASRGGVDKNGRFQNGQCHNQPGESSGRPRRQAIFRISGPVYLTQKDVRQVQLAKGAIRTGIECC